MFSLFRYKKNGLAYGFITIHEILAKDIFKYFETGRLVRKKSRKARKFIRSAIKFCKKKQVFPGQKIMEAKSQLMEIDKELEHMQRAAQVVLNETENIIRMIRQEKIEEILSLFKNASGNFKDKNIAAGISSLQEAETKLKNSFLPRSRNAIFSGLDSDIKSFKNELLKRNAYQ